MARSARDLRDLIVIALVPGTIALFAACGGAVRNSDSSFDGGIDYYVDANVPPEPVCDTPGACQDAGPPKPPNPPDPTYPTSHSPVPPVAYNGGNVLDAPEVVTVTFDGDTLRTTIEAFDDLITTTKWWDAVASEYCDARGKCIGHGTNGGHVHVSTPPLASYDDTAGATSSTLKQLIDAQIQSGLFPAPDANTIYALYFPGATTVSLDGAPSCQGFDGYHNTMTTTPPGALAPVSFTYAVLPRCSDSLTELTVAASHEFVEAATDPFITNDPTSYYSAFGSLTDAWDLAGGEVGDRCVDLTGQGLDQYTESGYVVQRSWSNAAAKASHDPCVPAPSPQVQPYFNMAPLAGGDTLTMSVGDTRIIALKAFSDGPMAPFGIDVADVSGQLGLSGSVEVALDETTMTNGQHANLTVTLDSAPDGAAFAVTSTSSGGVTHSWTFLVTSM